MVRERKKNQGKEKKKHMLECWTVPCCTNKFRENRLPFSHRDFLKEKEKKTADGKESSMVYQPIQRNLAFAAEFSGGTARVNGVPPPNISDQARSGQIVKETVFNLF